MKKIIFFLSFLIILASCGSDDDICLNSDSTPRLKLRFRNADDRFIRLDSLYVDVNYGNNIYKNIITQANVDSIFVPLRIDESPYTDIHIRSRKSGDTSKVRISYDKKAVYVSPACGFKINYENLKAELLQINPVLSVQSNHTTLNNEGKVNFYLHF